MDLSKLSDKDLQALAAGDLSKVSEEGLRTIIAIGNVQTVRKPIDEMLAKAEAKPEVSPGGIARQLGLTARAAVSGLTALPTMLADPITGLVNMVAGKQVAAPPSQTVQDLLNRILPQHKRLKSALPKMLLLLLLALAAQCRRQKVCKG